MSSATTPTITAVTVTYMARWHFLSKLVDRVIADEHVARLVIVSNGSADIESIKAARDAKPDRITVIELDKNYGSAVAFRKGLEEAGKTDSEYVLMLDDDNVPETGFGELFAGNLNLFTQKEEKGKIVLIGNRHLLPHNQDVFTAKPAENHDYIHGFFNVFSWKKAKRFFKILFRMHGKGEKKYPFLPIAVSESFAYGGTLLPMSAIRTAKYPDERLFTYGDDIVFSWNVKNQGYQTYICTRPLIDDIDISLDAEYHFLAFFKESTQPFKVFLKIRNSAFLSIKYSRNVLLTLVNMAVWLLGLFAMAVIRVGMHKLTFTRMRLILKAAYLGVKGDLTTQPKF